MSLVAGQSLAHYRITGSLGAGGMGEVWRAEDTELGREVALKLLPESFADDPQRHARFEREARLLASLNHPNIATLYGIEHVEPSASKTRSDPSPQAPKPASPEPVHMLVMELVEGDGLDQRIAQGPIPADEAIAIASQIAEALEAAHEQGIVHRDLKPANVKIRTDGTVKVLDFGLAKAWHSEDADASLSLSPTLTRHATVDGVILGTAAYMSPEQARGKPVDRRADIWAFGVVLWEMLTGRRLFDGETVTDVLAAVLRETPDIDAVPPDTPPHLRQLLARCLVRDPKLRLQAIGEARIALQAGTEGVVSEPPPITESRRPPWWSRLAWPAAGVCAVAAVVLGALLVTRDRPEPRTIRFEVSPPLAGDFYLDPDNPGPVAISPDGRALAFSARDADGAVRLFVRFLDVVDARALPGTENAQYPFWSPDSKRVAFFARDRLRVVDASGGPPVALCRAQDGKGGSWSPDGVIVFAPSYNTPIHSVSASGGESTAITEFDTEREDNSHRHPRFLPDGRHFLYMARTGTGSEAGQPVVIGSLDDPNLRQVLMYSPAAVQYASGHILFPRDRTLMARPFDPESLQFTGPAFPVAEDVTLLAPGTVVGVFSISQNGILAYQKGGATSLSQLVWRDRDGQQLGVLGEPDLYNEVNLTPDGTRALVTVTDPVRGTDDIWIFDIDRNVRTKFTFDPGFEMSIAPTPDGKAVVYTRGTQSTYAIDRKTIGGANEGEELLETEIDAYPSEVSPDGERVVFYRGGESSNWDLWILPLTGSKEPYPLIETDFAEREGAFSPDGRWLAYQSDESGRAEIYVVPFPGMERKWQISTHGGSWARWRPDGREIIYVAPDGTLTAVEVAVEDGGLVPGAARALFTVGRPSEGSSIWAQSPDGQRFLVLEPISGGEHPSVTVVVNWLTGD